MLINEALHDVLEFQEQTIYAASQIYHTPHFRRQHHRQVQFVIADLSGSTLGGHLGDGRILIDANAAGHGWFIDATPQVDEEFDRVVSRSQREATSGPAVDRADLLSVVMHEIGHAFGLEHGHGSATNVMNDTIGLGTRRSPTAWDAAVVDFLYWTGRRRRS